MYEKRGKIYADPGKVLVSAADGKVVGLSATGSSGDYVEHDAPLSAMRIDYALSLALWGGGAVACAVDATKCYAWYKTRLIKLRYSNDDQIAIMLNGNPAEVERMQRWRDWASEAAKEICRRLGIPE